MGSLLDSIYKPIVVHAMSFLPRSTLKLQSKYQIWGTLSSQGVGCFAARRYTYPLLLKCFVPFLICIKNMEETPVSICNSLIDYIALFLSMLTLKLHTKCQIWGIFPSQRMGWCPVRRGIHCCWSVSYPSIDKEGSYEELLITYTKPHIDNTIPFLPSLTLKVHTKYKIRVILYGREMGWYNATIGVHCYWSSSKSWLDLSVRWMWFLQYLVATFLHHTVLFLLRLTLKLHIQCQIQGTQPAQQVRCSTIRRDIHCCWSGSYPSLDV